MFEPDAVQPPAIELEMVASGGQSFPAKLLDSLYDGVYFVNTERRITYWNKGAERLTGYPAAEALGRRCFENFLMHVNEAGCALCMGGCPLQQTITDGECREAEVFLRHKEGHRVPVSVRASPIQNSDGSIVGAVEIFSDISAIKKLERKAGELEGLAYFDALTGVANRRYIELKVEQAIQELQHFDRSYGIILIDIDRFKSINDTYGHQAGDLLLKAVCETLQNSSRPGDTIGRWGGDEFLVLIRDVTETLLDQITDRFRRMIGATSVPAAETRIRVSASIGGTLLKKGDSSRCAFDRADRLMYSSKSNGRNCSNIG